jgi:hypothetical protein
MFLVSLCVPKAKGGAISIHTPGIGGYRATARIVLAAERLIEWTFTYCNNIN